jgi:DNA-nicking Smr family endonuclease
MTSDRHPGSRSSRRKLSEEERRLWSAVARSIKPLRQRPRLLEADEIEPEPVPPRACAKRASPAAAAHPPAKRPAAAKPAVPPKSVTPGLSPLARRERQRLARGTAAIDARIDLHGLTQSEAHAALAHFLRRAQADGARFVLVITGKGASLGGRFSGHGTERGVLRRQVPLWLRLPEFRAYVVGFEDAHATHGGEGAIYVRIRRSRA